MRNIFSGAFIDIYESVTSEDHNFRKYTTSFDRNITPSEITDLETDNWPTIEEILIILNGNYAKTHR